MVIANHDRDTVGQARARFFAATGFSEATYSEPWSRVKLGPIVFFVPNTPMRQRALPLHDLHHVLTGYDTSLKGEAELAAWELASGGLGKYPIGWFYVLGIAMLGLILYPRAMPVAFRRGRGSTNLFRTDFSEALLSLTTGELKRRLRVRSTGEIFK
jgi:ubiquinone biosynthesis protein Coq4